MLDHWIVDFDGYADWFYTQIDTTAGAWEHPPQFEYDAMYGDDDTDAVWLRFTRNDLVFPDRSKLKVEFTVSASFSYAAYSYHYSTPSESVVWRYCKHTKRAFEREHGTDCHVHRGSDDEDQAEPTAPVDIEDVLDLIPNRGWPCSAELNQCKMVAWT